MAMTIDPRAQADLAAQLAGIAIAAQTAHARELAEQVEQLRRMAFTAGLLPVVAVAHALEGALATAGHAPIIDWWLAILGDAIACGRCDKQASDIFTAACSVRLAG